MSSNSIEVARATVVDDTLLEPMGALLAQLSSSAATLERDQLR